MLGRLNKSQLPVNNQIILSRMTPRPHRILDNRRGSPLIVHICDGGGRSLRKGHFLLNRWPAGWARILNAPGPDNRPRGFIKSQSPGPPSSGKCWWESRESRGWTFHPWCRAVYYARGRRCFLSGGIFHPREKQNWPTRSIEGGLLIWRSVD